MKKTDVFVIGETKVAPGTKVQLISGIFRPGLAAVVKGKRTDTLIRQIREGKLQIVGETICKESTGKFTVHHFVLIQ